MLSVQEMKKDERSIDMLLCTEDGSLSYSREEDYLSRSYQFLYQGIFVHTKLLNNIDMIETLIIVPTTYVLSYDQTRVLTTAERTDNLGRYSTWIEPSSHRIIIAEREDIGIVFARLFDTEKPMDLIENTKLDNYRAYPVYNQHNSGVRKCFELIKESNLES